MLEWISWFIVSTMFIIVYSYMYAIINQKKIHNIRITDLLFVILTIILQTIIKLYQSQEFALIMIYILMLFVIKKIYNDNISKIIITTFLIYIIFAVSEMLFSLLFVFIIRIDQDFFRINPFGILMVNIIILTVSLLLIKIDVVKNKIFNIIKWYVDKKTINTISITLIGVVTVYILLHQNYIDFVSNLSFVVTNIFLIGVIVFIVGFFKEKTDNNKLTSEYDQLLDYVKTYEEVVELKGKQQHEYKNQLILIKGMIENGDKKLDSYMDNLLKNEIENYETTWINKLKNIPSGGLKGLIHYKIFQMIHEGINVYVEINDCINNKRCTKYLNDNLEDISKIIGVYLDNAREASAESDKKYVIIEVSEENKKIEINISNTFSNIINLDKIDKMGYSTKGSGRGYGLSLANDILIKHPEIMQYRNFDCGFYAQYLIFEQKNKKQN